MCLDSGLFCCLEACVFCFGWIVLCCGLCIDCEFDVAWYVDLFGWRFLF